MHILAVDSWGKFIKKDGSFDGRLFEQLVERLLNLHFDGLWKITKVSWDGGKDAVSESVRTTADGVVESVLSWAECKMHRAPLALRLISNTLVMAVVDGAERLLLFSYSPLINNARLELARFTQATGITVEIVDDEVLEDAILAHFHELRGQFFPGVIHTPPTRSRSGGLRLIPRLSRDFDTDPLRLGDDVDGEATSRNICHSVNLRAIMRLQLAVHNLSLDEHADVSVTIEGAEPMQSPFELIYPEEATENRVIAARTVSLFEYIFRASHAGSRVSLPRLVVTQSGQALPPVDLGKVDVRSLLLPPLIGARFHEFILKFRTLASLRNKAVYAVISGRAGTGKSRLTSELVSQLLESGREIHSFDGAANHGGSFGAFVRRLLAKLYRLPDFTPPGPFPASPAENGIDVSVGLYRLLYDHDVDLSEHTEEVRSLVTRGIGAGRVALVVDNVQYLSPETIGLLSHVADDHDGAASKFAGVFVFNSDYLQLNNTALDFFKSLSQKCVGDDASIISCELSDLGVEEMNLFFDHLVSIEGGRHRHGFSSRYPLLAEMMRKKILPRPLHLLQTLFYLADVGALRRRDDFLYVENIDRLHSAIHETPPGLENVLDERWNNVLKTFPGLADPMRLLALFRSIRLEDWRPLGQTESHWDLLISLGLARESVDAQLGFFHEQVERHFAKTHANFDPKDASALSKLLSETGLSAIYLPSHVIVSAQADSVDGELIRRACALVNEGIPANSLNVAFGECLRGLIRNRPGLPSDEELRTVQKLILLVSAPRGLAYRLEVFDAEVGIRKHRLNRFADAGPELMALLRDHASWYFGTHEDGRALHLLNEANDILQRLRFPSDHHRDLSRASILNRLCVAYKSLGDHEMALSAGNESLAIAQHAGAQELVLLNHVDLGYVFYGSQSPSEQLRTHWRLAADCFHKNEHAISAKGFDFAACGNLIFAHSKLLDRDLGVAGEVIDLWAQRCMRALNSFYGVSFMLLQILRHLMEKDCADRISLLRNLSDMATDACLTFNVRRAYWQSLHARAKVEALAGDGATAVKYFDLALEQLLLVSNTANEPRYRYFFEDMVITAKSFGCPVPKSANKIRNADMRFVVVSIDGKTADQFETFLSSYRPVITYSNENRALFCP